MKKKEIVMVFFVLLVTALALFVILQTTNNNSNNNVSKANLESSSNDNKEASSTKTPTVIDQSGSSTTNDSTKSTDNNKSNTSNSSSDVDADDEPRDDEDSSSTISSNETYTLYEVKKGETLLSITKSYEDVCPASILSKAILKANNLTKANEIKETMKIKIPDRYTTGSSYTVKSGDNLYTIAKSSFNNISVNNAIKQLKSDNFISTDSIKVGQKLFITNTFSTATSTSSVDETSEDNSTSTNTVPVSDKELVTYTLKTGETLSTIAKKYEKYCPLSVSSKAILSINGVTDAKNIKVGSDIKIPEKYLTNGEKYTVKAGDTLSEIASTLLSEMAVNDAINKIKSDNNISTDNIKSGEQLYITTLSLNIEKASN